MASHNAQREFYSEVGDRWEMATPTASGAYNDGKCLAQMFWNRRERLERMRRYTVA